MNYPSIESKGPNLVFFLETLSESLPADKEVSRELHLPFKYSLTSYEACFIFNLRNNEIDRHVGLERFIGVEGKEVSLEMLLSGIHPEDRKDIELIIQETMLQILNSELPVGTNYLNFSFRMKSVSGQYFHVISKNIIHSVDSEGRPIGILVKYQKVNFLENPLVVNWWVDPSCVDGDSIESRLTEDVVDVFTNREKDISALIVQGLSSLEIANELNLSQHTVITHRKNIFSKSNSHSVDDLKLFCLRNRAI